MPELIIFILTLPVVLLYIVLLLTWKKVNNKDRFEPTVLPFISILISVRNEESNIVKLCQSLDQLDYPIDRFEILVGDDHSSDNSVGLFKVNAPENASITKFSDESASGKKNVLAKLLGMAKGDFFVFTDGDMTFNPGWLKGMLYKTTNTPNMKFGVTKIESKHWFGMMQNLDWLISQGILAWFANKGKPLTAWGNNLIIDKVSYETIGGFEIMEATIVEDVELMNQLKKANGQVQVKFDLTTLAETQPESSLLRLLHQRKRWLKGTYAIPIMLKIGLFLKLFFIPLIIFGIAIQPYFVIWFLVYLVLSFSFVLMIFKRIDQKVRIIPFLSFLIYEFVVYFLTFVFYLLPVKTIWKNRFY